MELFPSVSGSESFVGMTEAAVSDEWEHVERPHLAEEGNAVFPPSLHEGLDLHPYVHLGVEISASAVENEEKIEEEERAVMQWCPLSGSARRSLETGLEMVCSRIPLWRGKGGSWRGGGGWWVAAVAGFAGLMMYLRRRRRREKELLLLLNKDKDQVIDLPRCFAKIIIIV
ncbi:hypothetical protein BHE74_00008279 [Ensete ventricosum]|nr:hypothetical protein GW17_00011135 [Ensete ventricosum]RWW83219.1 hypothetical protein BHE74_00008279 [Ensete ventricosum]RZS02041.1 hypothetical protein BHM03_00032014 [Ensete ventricosum]